MASTTNPWLQAARPNPAARVRLFCFPYSGGASSSIYRTWPKEFPAVVEVCPVELPGRGTRFGDAPFTDMKSLISALAQALTPLLVDKPFALFGHSLGALVSFELARELRRRKQAAPVVLLASGCRAPRLPDPDPPVRALPREKFIEELRKLNGTPAAVLENAELMDLLLPLLRADASLSETYVYEPEPPLPCPIVALGGLGDKSVPREQSEAWREETASSFSAHFLPGDHFFVHSAQPSVVRLATEATLRNLRG